MECFRNRSGRSKEKMRCFAGGRASHSTGARSIRSAIGAAQRPRSRSTNYWMANHIAIGRWVVTGKSARGLGAFQDASRPQVPGVSRQRCGVRRPSAAFRGRPLVPILTKTVIMEHAERRLCAPEGQRGHRGIPADGYLAELQPPHARPGGRAGVLNHHGGGMFGAGVQRGPFHAV